MYAVPSKVRKRRHQNHSTPEHQSQSCIVPRMFCTCCRSDNVQKTRYIVEEDMPPPPSPPQAQHNELPPPLEELMRRDSVERVVTPRHIPVNDVVLNQVR
ncbi:hypothetical protein CBL_21101 [Carabus blaptoides fortunei]